MEKLLLLLLIAFTSIPARAGEDCKAKDAVYAVCEDQGKLLESAITGAKEAKKPLVIVFGANWCPWCQSMHRILRDAELPEAKEYAIAEIGLYNGQEKIPSGTSALDRVLKMAGKPKAGDGLPILAIVNPAKGKAEFVNTQPLEKNTKVSKGHDPEKVFAALAKARARLE